MAAQAPPPASVAPPPPASVPAVVAAPLPSVSASSTSLDEWQAKTLAAAEAELAVERDKAIRELEEEATRLAEHIAMQATARAVAASAPVATPGSATAASTRAQLAVVPPPRQVQTSSIISTDLVQARAAASAARARAERERVAAVTAESAAIAAEAAVTAAGGATAASYDVTVQAISLRSAADEAAHVAAVAAAEASSLETLADVVAERIALEAELGARSGPGVERLLAFGSPSGSPAATAGTWASGVGVCGQVRPRLTRLLRMQARVVPRN